MEIAKYFERISKKRDLSNKSSYEEASKKLRNGQLFFSILYFTLIVLVYNSYTVQNNIVSLLRCLCK